MSEPTSQRARRDGRDSRPRAALKRDESPSTNGHAQPDGASAESDLLDGDGAALGRYRNELIVGLAALLAVAALAVGVRYMMQLPLLGGGVYTLEARFADAGGLTEGRPVTMSGLPVGTVGAVRLDPKARGVRAELRIEEDVKVPRGSKANVSGVAALGGAEVAIRRGPPGAPPLEAGGRLPAGEPGALGQLQERAGPMAARLDTALAGAAGTMQRAERLLAGSGGDLEATFDNLRAASEGTRALVDGQEARLGRTLSNVETLTADLEAAAADVRRLTGESGDSLGVAVARVNRTLAELESVSTSASRTAASLESVAARIEAGEGTLGRLARDESLYRHADSTMARLARVMRGFEEDPGRYLGELKLVEVF